MRKLKFRAWNKTENWMDEAFAIHSGGHIYQDVRKKYNTPNHEIESAYDDLIIMQFTGCEDSGINGNEVYESDIIENCDTKDLQIVFWNEDEAAWYCRYHNSDRIVSLADSIGNLNKVVGNVYENKDIL